MDCFRRRVAFVLMAGVGLAGCVTGPPKVQDPVVGVETVTHDELLALPAPQSKIAVAVYAFEDETGQFEFSDTVQTLSRAVTQGATSILIEALLEAGDGTWFTVVEREGIDNLLRERQIIRETRAIYEGGGDLSRNYLPPLLFAGMMVEGGIVGYDTNTLTGGVGARLLGIGGNTEFRQDTVTVYLRAVSTQSGEVLESVNVSKTIFSVAISANVFRFISSDEILEIDTGLTTNEPEHLAVKQAIEKAVIALVLDGARDQRWAFADPQAGAAFLADVSGEPPVRQAEAGSPEAVPEPDRADGAGGPAGPAPTAMAEPRAEPVPDVEASPPARTGVALRNTPETAERAARATGRGVDRALARQALNILVAESGGERSGRASAAERQEDGAWLRKVGEPEIIPLQQQRAPAGPSHRVDERERRSPARPSAPAFVRVAAQDEQPEPSHGGSVTD